MAEKEGSSGLPPDPVDEQGAIRWLEEKWGQGKTCPYCDANDWGVMGARRLLIESGQTEPLFAVACRNCGNTVLIESRFAGLRVE